MLSMAQWMSVCTSQQHKHLLDWRHLSAGWLAVLHSYHMWWGCKLGGWLCNLWDCGHGVWLYTVPLLAVTCIGLYTANWVCLRPEYHHTHTHTHTGRSPWRCQSSWVMLGHGLVGYVGLGNIS